MSPRLCLALLLVGCAGAPAAPPRAPAPIVAAIVAPAPIAPTPIVAPAPILAPAPIAPAAIVTPIAPAAILEPTVAPTPTTCVIQQTFWDSPTARPLRTPRGRPYATIRRADDLTLRSEGGAVAEFTAHGLRLRTHPRARDLPLYTRVSLVFADTLQAGLTTPLTWTPALGPTLQVTPPSDPRVRFVTAPAVAVACASLTLTPGFGELPVPDHRLRARPTIAVAASAGGPAVLHLRLTRDVPVKLVERVGAQARIAWPIADGALTDATVLGWVDARLVAPPGPATLGTLHGFAGLGLIGTSHWGGCASEHPLHVDTGRGPEEVGTILPGTRVTPGPRRGALVEVVVLGPATRSTPDPFQLRPGATFLLAPADARECAH